ncbi:hypothetical protein QPK32_25880 [Massilia sp. YIM B02763]|uniref:hypothetical protein n=1 Tax=Massilia sp. YIM B02763 TaxID=3050130 RepID=UPI0025B671A7|nr:hypothetical protein [Massilia sp. YIM B02763]MDN4056491.1 hypothetical protein [Massilia sp. YIM B02763]
MTFLRLLSRLLVRFALLLLLPLPLAAHADDFPTSGRVEYVLECMQKHDGKYEFLYKCSCVIDRIARELPYDDYVAMSTALRNQGLGGERGGLFRDAGSAKDMASKYKTIEASASKACAVPQR